MHYIIYSNITCKSAQFECVFVVKSQMNIHLIYAILLKFSTKLKTERLAKLICWSEHYYAAPLYVILPDKLFLSVASSSLKMMEIILCTLLIQTPLSIGT